MARQRSAKPTTRTADEIGPRQPCPCGSGKRYKACHGAPGGGAAYVVRSFEGLPGECDWVALREFVQSGTAPLTLKAGAVGEPEAGVDDAAAPQCLVVSLLPGIAPALKREDGAVWLGVQVAHRSGDVSADLAQALELGLAAAPGAPVAAPQPTASSLRLQDVVDLTAEFTVTIHDGFDFWFEGVDDAEGRLAATLEQLNATIEPASRLTSVEAAYWVSTGTKEHLRWVMPHEEEPMLTALARLHESSADHLVEGSRLVGSFRAHGLLVPVWDLPLGTGSEALEEPAAAFAVRVSEALADTSPLTETERSARSGLSNRQLTIR